MEAGLYIVGTPIGNLGDISLRALDTLRGVQCILAEDTRRTRKLLTKHGLHTPLASCHKFNEAARVDRVVRQIEAGAALALVSDSGMPGISDPGVRVVRACRARGLSVTVVPGPCSVTAAVSLSGFGGNGYRFDGFLARKSGARHRQLASYAEVRVPVVFFESPHRILRTLAEMADILGEREILLAREMTKLFEETIRGTPADILRGLADRKVKGEIVVVVSAGP